MRHPQRNRSWQPSLLHDRCHLPALSNNMATKSAKRRAAREARFSPPPPPEQTTAMAASGMDVNRGNSDQVPLSDKGADEIQDTAAKLAARGGIDKAIVSTSVRGRQTADAIQAAHPPMQRTN